jgi:hypothetical protein
MALRLPPALLLLLLLLLSVMVIVRLGLINDAGLVPPNNADDTKCGDDDSFWSGGGVEN